MLARKPRKGDRISWIQSRSSDPSDHGTITRVDGRIAWYKYKKGGQEHETCFIWGFCSPGGPVMEKPPKIDGGPEGWLYPNQLVTIEER